MPRIKQPRDEQPSTTTTKMVRMSAYLQYIQYNPNHHNRAAVRELDMIKAKIKERNLYINEVYQIFNIHWLCAGTVRWSLFVCIHSRASETLSKTRCIYRCVWFHDILTSTIAYRHISSSHDGRLHHIPCWVLCTVYLLRRRWNSRILCKNN